MVDANAVPTQSGEGQNILWKTAILGRGHSSPTILGDRIYLATADESAERQSVVALNRETGAIVWTSDLHEGHFPKSDLHAKSTHANATVASDGRQLYIGFLNDGKIFASALDLDGEIQWQVPLGEFKHNYGYAPSPAIYKDLVLYAADNPGSGFLAAVHRVTGDIVWRKPRKSTSSYSSPVVVTIDGVDQLVISGGGRVISYSPLTGEELWRKTELPLRPVAQSFGMAISSLRAADTRKRRQSQ